MKKVLREIIETVLLAAVVFLVLQFTVESKKVEGASMEPTLEAEERLLVNKAVYFHLDMQRVSDIVPFYEVETPKLAFPIHPPRTGDVVVFHFPRDPRKDFVKRVIGIPGDTIEIREGTVYRNGKPLEEPYVKNRSRSSMRPVAVGPNSYFVLGDNRVASSDSREWGTVPLQNMVGKVWFTYWPVSRLSLLQAWSWMLR